MNSASLVIAATITSRARGLLGTAPTWGGGDTVLAIVPCASVHTFGMKYPIDVAFASKDGVVLRAERNVEAGRMLFCRKAILTLERPHSNTPWYESGDQLDIGK